MSTPFELLASYWTLAGNVSVFGGEPSPVDFRTRAEAAARAGYTGIGLNHADLLALDARHGLKEVKAIAEGAGLRMIELEALSDWFADGQRRAASDLIRRDLLIAAGELGASYIKVAGELHVEGIPRTDWPVEKMAESFAKLCAEAALAGTRVALEIMPFSNIADIATGLAVVGRSGPANGGLLLDSWHVHRGNIQFDDITAIPRGRIAWAELDDASAEVEGSLLEDTIERRKLCGEGDFDLPGFIAAVLRTGYNRPFGVEILSDEHRQRSPGEAARLSYDTAIRQFAGLTPNN